MPDADNSCLRCLIVELITPEQREELSIVYGKSIIDAALNNAQALRLLQSREYRQAKADNAAWQPPTLEEAQRYEEHASFERMMKRRQSGKLGSET